jgi:putative CocE/NonD family hydrolase
MREHGRMTLASRVIGRSFKLQPAVTRDVTLERDIPVPMRDGVVLKTNHFAPRLDNAPTVMIRSPYGRSGIIGVATGRVLAERGFHVVLQSCRGTFGSGGEFHPMRHERSDGLDTIAWIEQQPWFDGDLFTYGPSYVGFTQWAVADSPAIKGMLLAVTASSFRDPTYAGGSFSLDTVVNWAGLIGDQGGSLLSFAAKQLRTRRRIRGAWNHLPLSEVDVVATRREVAFVREWLANADDEAYWLERGHEGLITGTTAPICMVGGWYDIFLPWQLADYAKLRAAGHQPRLVIGAWTHANPELLSRSLREAVDFYRDRSPEAKPVALYVGGAGEWRTFAEWPPAARTREWFLGPDRALTTTPVTATGSDRLRYDPSDPTPSPGGPLLTEEAGHVDNRAVEARPDVLVYTSEVLAEDVEAIGPVSADIALRTSSPYFDIFVRICDVAPDGRSENVCDGLTRVNDGAERVHVELWPTAYRWKAGHRIRVQIAGAAHPRYARNTGTGEPLGKATTLRTIDYEIMLGPSAITLPMPV